MGKVFPVHLHCVSRPDPGHVRTGGQATVPLGPNSRESKPDHRCRKLGRGDTGFGCKNYAFCLEVEKTRQSGVLRLVLLLTPSITGIARLKLTREQVNARVAHSVK